MGALVWSSTGIKCVNVRDHFVLNAVFCLIVLPPSNSTTQRGSSDMMRREWPVYKDDAILLFSSRTRPDLAVSEQEPVSDAAFSLCVCVFQLRGLEVVLL